MPNKIPKIAIKIFDISKASGIKSKQITYIIRQDAKNNIKLKNLLETLLNKHPIIPPRVVPKVPKNKPKRQVLRISI